MPGLEVGTRIRHPWRWSFLTGGVVYIVLLMLAGLGWASFGAHVDTAGETAGRLLFPRLFAPVLAGSFSKLITHKQPVWVLSLVTGWLIGGLLVLGAVGRLLSRTA